MNKIKHILKCDGNKKKIYARKTVVREITMNEAKVFLNKNHIQGFVSSTIYLGCFYNDLLVGVMTFKSTGMDGKFDLNRFATNINYNCIGVGGKLFKYFIRSFHFKEVKSFLDRRWCHNEEHNLYTSIGFKFDGYVPPSYSYYNSNQSCKPIF